MNRTSGAAPSRSSRVHSAVSLPDDVAPLFTVSQAASMLDMQPAFIRRLDTEGVVCPARSAGGQRRYSRIELGHIAAVAALMSEGMTLVGAQRIIELENEVAELRRQLAVARTGKLLEPDSLSRQPNTANSGHRGRSDRDAPPVGSG